ncbi:MAG: Rab family GTPase [Candidatus Heimdallarchaeota archaeon]
MPPRNFVFKLLVAGDGGVGKTTLLRRYVDGIFDESTITTIGVDFFLKEIHLEEGNCSLQLWDLGGQERFRHLLSNFVMGARASLLLIDLTKMPQMGNVLNWVNIIRLHDISLPIILVGTKLDLEDAISMDDDTALDIKNTFNMLDFIKTSSKTGQNVNIVFELIAKKLMRKGKY